MPSIHVIVPERRRPLSRTADRFCRAVSRDGGEVVFHRVVETPEIPDDVKALGLCNPTDEIVLSKYRSVLSGSKGDCAVFLDDDILVQRPSVSALRWARDSSWGITAFPVFRSIGWDFSIPGINFSQLKHIRIPRAVGLWSRSFFAAKWDAALAITDPANLGGPDPVMELPQRMALATQKLGIISVIVDWCRGREVASA
jgi:hypothetical protein